MIIIIGSGFVKPACHADALRLSLEHVQRSRREVGCLAHNVSLDAEDPTRLVFVEYWADMAAVQAHFALADSRHFVKALSAMLTSPPDMKLFTAEEVSAG